jgi:glycerophosphoryl diester phosphodiesterase
MNAWRTLDGRPPRVVAHRGASGYLPEHTLPAYALAVEQGADVIEPDLVMSSDGVLYARHDLFLSRSTDIAARAEFAGRARERNGVRDWWVGDFDAAELDALRAIQPWPQRDHGDDGRHALPRFEAILDFAQGVATARGAALPVYPEIKHPDYFQALGLDPVQAVVGTLQARGLAGPDAPVWLQCFDHEILRDAHRRCGNPCFALFEEAGDTTSWVPRLRELAGWARGVAPDKQLLWDARGRDRGLVAAAHAAGLEVHAWTFRDDADAFPFTDPAAALGAAFALGVDAVFCDFPDTAVAIRAASA